MKRLIPEGSVREAVAMYFLLLAVMLSAPALMVIEGILICLKRALKACGLGPRRWYAQDARYRRSLSEEGGCHD